ncbi:MAG: sulfatase-like hydrolase/transferase [Planctomycetes bacterium]|nr:sulfatase-like hydrolase/transferase [Planctomycetota bacterium]
MPREIDRRRFIRLLLGGAIGCATVPGALPRRLALARAAKPNLLFLFTDDQTFRSIGALNNPAVKTPTIDRLVRRGTTFTHCFNQGAWHGAVCVASRAMLNTGRGVWHCGWDDCTDPDGAIYPLWGECLGKNGYDTYVTGKWHNGPATLKKAFATIGPTGGGMLPSQDRRAKENEAEGIVKDPYDRPRPGNSWSPSDTTLGGHWREKDGQIIHSSRLWADTAIGWLRDEIPKRENPFFLYVAFHAPHDPRQSPKEFIDMYPRDRIEIPPNFRPLHPFDPMGDYRTLRDERLAPFPRTEEAIKAHLQEYYAIISHADQQIGRILAALEASGKADDTIIIFSADQGLAVGQHGLMGKQNQYDHSVRMPLIFAGPGIASDERIDAQVYLGSLFATTCEMAGIRPPETVEFPSLMPLLRGERERLYDAIYGAYMDQQRMVRTERYKLIRYPRAGEVQLFDLKDDPWETRDLAEDPRHADTVRQLDALLRREMAKAGDPLDLADPKPIRRPARKAAAKAKKQA